MGQVCAICKIYKEFSEFSPDKRRKDGYTSFCKECRRKRYAEQYRFTEQKRYYGNLEQNREKLRLRRNKNKQNFQDYSSLGSLRKKELKYNIQTVFKKDDFEIVRIKFNRKCFKCGTSELPSIDHHYPVHLGFRLEISNAVLLCKRCNSSKYRQLPEKFYTFGELNILYCMGIAEIYSESIEFTDTIKNDYY